MPIPSGVVIRQLICQIRYRGLEFANVIASAEIITVVELVADGQRAGTLNFRPDRTKDTCVRVSITSSVDLLVIAVAQDYRKLGRAFVPRLIHCGVEGLALHYMHYRSGGDS